MASKPAKNKQSEKLHGLTWLSVPAVLQIVSTFMVFIVGRLRLLPSHIDANGIAISFASDGTRYQSESVELIQTLARDGIVAWFKSAPSFHVKVYSLSYAALGRLVGFNILAVEPLNVLFYLATICIVFKLGRELFSREVGILSAAIVAVWPSFLLHSTQLLRDPLFIALWLLLILYSFKVADEKSSVASRRNDCNACGHGKSVSLDS